MHAGMRILFVGDSVTGNHYHATQSFLAMRSGGFRALAADDRNRRLAGGWPSCDSQPHTSPKSTGCAFELLCNQRVAVGMVRNDHLLDVPARRWQPYPVNVLMHPWRQSLTQFAPTHVVLNRGAHFTDDAKYEAGLREGVALVRELAPHATIFLRSTPPGHLNCHKRKPSAMGPLEKPQSEAILPYHWGEFSRQDRIMQRVARELLVLYLDFAAPTRLRPDGHHHRDCLHYSGGPIYTWVRLTAAAVAMRKCY